MEMAKTREEKYKEALGKLGKALKELREEVKKQQKPSFEITYSPLEKRDRKE